MSFGKWYLRNLFDNKCFLIINDHWLEKEKLCMFSQAYKLNI